jgi:hypothetical protein
VTPVDETQATKQLLTELLPFSTGACSPFRSAFTVGTSTWSPVLGAPDITVGTRPSRSGQDLTTGGWSPTFSGRISWSQDHAPIRAASKSISSDRTS